MDVDRIGGTNLDSPPQADLGRTTRDEPGNSLDARDVFVAPRDGKTFQAIHRAGGDVEAQQIDGVVVHLAVGPQLRVDRDGWRAGIGLATLLGAKRRKEAGEIDREDRAHIEYAVDV